jgi:isopentenyldiphosphate isomerase
VEEIFDIIDDRGEVIGTAPREACHGNPALVHRAVHVLVFNDAGEIYLQRRSETKKIQPDRWDSSVGGHLASGETYEVAAIRETEEELGFIAQRLEFLFTFKIRNAVESEDTMTFRTIYNGEIYPDATEISEGRFWTFDEIMLNLGSGIFTPAFEVEFMLLTKAKRDN